MDTRTVLRTTTLGLGLLGIGLGLANVLFPRAAARVAPRRADPGTLRLAGAAAAMAGVGLVVAARHLDDRRRPLRDYSDRSGFPAPPHAMRGRAGDFEVPRDFRIPELLRPYRRDLH